MERYAKEQQVLRKLEDNGWEAWFVGGCVRDALRGEPCDDIDITTNATPQEVMAVFGAENIIETGLAHGTVTVKPQMAEVTTYRTEGAYTDHRHPDQVTFVRSLPVSAFDGCGRRWKDGTAKGRTDAVKGGNSAAVVLARSVIS